VEVLPADVVAAVGGSVVAAEALTAGHRTKTSSSSICATRWIRETSGRLAHLPSVVVAIASGEDSPGTAHVDVVVPGASAAEEVVDRVQGAPMASLAAGGSGEPSLARRIGRRRTAWLAITGGTIDASTALAWRLIDEIADDEP